MSTTPIVLNPVTMNAELAKAVAGATDTETIKAALLAEAAKQQTAAEDAAAVTAEAEAKAAAEKAEAAKHAAEIQTYTRVETIGGREVNFEASNELELERMVNNAYKVAYALQPGTEEPEVSQVDPAAAQKAAEEKAEAQSELELKFKRGEVTAAEYIKQSGIMESYLADQGISIDAMKGAIEKTQNSQYEESWAQATTEFLKHSDWPGGDRNLALISDKLIVLGLADAKDKVAALAQAWNSMKTSGMYFPDDVSKTPVLVPPAAATVPVTPTVAVVAPPAAPVVVKTPAQSSSIFGASSGMSGGDGVGKVAPKGDVPIDPNASPAEILAAWNAAQIAAGKDPNAAFRDVYAARRA